MRWIVGILLTGVACGSSPAPGSGAVQEEFVQDHDAVREQVGNVLDGFHQAASRADFDGLFGAMTDDAVFIGTDASERWERAEFEAYVKPRFSEGQGWTYIPVERHVDVRGEVAWFDERLTHARYGELRSSGALLRQPDGGWKLRHYVLSFPVPNEIAGDVVTQIRALGGPDSE